MTRLTFTVTEAAQILGVSRGLLYSQVRNGDVKAIKLGRRYVITKATLEEMLGHSFDLESVNQ
jgi:excisionase family DNA binding protein